MHWDISDLPDSRSGGLHRRVDGIVKGIVKGKRPDRSQPFSLLINALLTVLTMLTDFRRSSHTHVRGRACARPRVHARALSIFTFNNVNNINEAMN